MTGVAAAALLSSSDTRRRRGTREHPAISRPANVPARASRRRRWPPHERLWRLMRGAAARRRRGTLFLAPLCSLELFRADVGVDWYRRLFLGEQQPPTVFRAEGAERRIKVKTQSDSDIAQVRSVPRDRPRGNRALTYAARRIGYQRTLRYGVHACLTAAGQARPAIVFRAKASAGDGSAPEGYSPAREYNQRVTRAIEVDIAKMCSRAPRTETCPLTSLIIRSLMRPTATLCRHAYEDLVAAPHRGRLRRAVAATAQAPR